MFDSRNRLHLVAAAVLFSGLVACSSASPRNQGGGGSGGAEEETGGSTGTGGKATGGSGGKSTGGSTGSTGGSTGSTGGSTGSTGGSTGSTGGSGGGATGGSGGATGGSGGATGGSGGAGTGGSGGGGMSGDGGMSMGGPVLACWADPKVIKICHQLENACENCGPMKGVAPPRNTKAQPCFDLVNAAYKGMATDADCEKHAIDNDCTVDNVATTGNVCGSLDCTNPACAGKVSNKTCDEAKGWGDSSICKTFYAKCPCK
jgi:hypothetical protein